MAPAHRRADERQITVPPMRLLKFLAVIITALALVPGGAHLFALPNKITLAAEPYFVTQTVYRGWALFGIVLFVAIAANAAVAILQARHGGPFYYAAGAALCVVATLIVFFTWTFPANQATSNWTAVPDDWQALRVHWEYSHAANAGITFVALCLAVLAAMTPEPGSRPA